MSLRQKLQNLKIAGKSISEYLSEVNAIIQALAVAGEKFEDTDLVILVLSGLDDEYEALVQNVTSRQDEVTYRMLKTMLMDNEVWQRRSNQTNAISVNMVDISNKSLKNSKNSSQLCQICSKKGHVALNCFNKINLTKYPPQQKRTLTSYGVTASANMTYEAGKSVWYSDSGATNHITGNVTNIQNPKSCNKSTNAADGRPMSIAHYGTSVFSSNNRNYVLDDLLMVPTSTKNLLSVKRFCCDNQISIEFNPRIVKVKDLE